MVHFATAPISSVDRVVRKANDPKLLELFAIRAIADSGDSASLPLLTTGRDEISHQIRAATAVPDTAFSAYFISAAPVCPPVRTNSPFVNDTVAEVQRAPPALKPLIFV